MKHSTPHADDVPKVIITDLSNRSSYYQWFLYGLMLLHRQRRIKLKFHVPFHQWLKLHRLSKYWEFVEILYQRRLNRKNKAQPEITSLLRGYVISPNGRKKLFCIDSADSPYIYSGKDLATRDVYFKMQCPCEFKADGFELGHVIVPWIDYEFVDGVPANSYRGERRTCPEVMMYAKKIRPLLIGVRRLSWFLTFADLDCGYKNVIASREVEKTKIAMCYFGNSEGPGSVNFVGKPDFNREKENMSYFGELISHPNKKRAKIADILDKLGDGYDARIIHRGKSDAAVRKSVAGSLVIPLTEFSRHVAQFQYNINVSGYRMSIPNRFIDSFVCGTAIATDNLHVRWYVPFDGEVVEIGEMGYLPDADVDYSAIAKKLASLPTVNQQQVIDKYERYYSPIRCAEYIVRTLTE